MALLNLSSTPKPSSTEYMNEATFTDYYERLRLLATSIFQWKNMPAEIDCRYLEQALFMTGRCLFFKDLFRDLGYMALQCTPADTLNVYNVPTKSLAVSHLYTYRYGLTNSVLIRNNYDMIPTHSSICLFAERLATAERIIDINVRAQKIPLFVRCDQKQLSAIKAVFKQYSGNEPCIVVDKSMSSDIMEVFKTDAPYNEEKLTRYKHNLWNEAMTYLGINNANTDKPERLITSEVDSNTQLIANTATVMLMTRQEAAEQINKMFGLNISCQMRDIGSALKPQMQVIEAAAVAEAAGMPDQDPDDQQEQDPEQKDGDSE